MAEPQGILIFDGDCGFCRSWIERWKSVTGDSVDYRPYQEVAVEVPSIRVEEFEKAVHFVDAQGRISRAAEAVFTALSYARGQGFWLRIYRKSRVFRSITEFAYAQVAQRRVFFSWMTWLLLGDDIRVPTYDRVRAIFIRGLGAVGVAAVASFAPQVLSLVGEKGLLPSGFPDFLLFLACAIAGASALGLLIGGQGRRAAVFAGGFFVSWLFLVRAGQDFMAFQWELLLLETMALAALWSLLPARGVGLWGLRLLLFRLILGSGLAKIQSGDPAWRSWTALRFHFETQPLPTPLAIYAHRLPFSVLDGAAAGVLFLEILLPWLALGPRRIRHLAFYPLIGLQIMILLTGNYAYFNWLTILLCVLLLDDRALGLSTQPASVSPSVFAEDSRSLKPAPGGRWWVKAVVFLVSLLGLSTLAGVRVPFVDERVRLLGLAQPFGLFSVMTTTRNEVVIEGSEDGAIWKEYGFRAKPGPLWIAPHQPRLDWMLWFAAMSSYQDNPWLERLLVQLLEGNPRALSLMGEDPFAGKTPRRIRASLYRYQFSRPSGATAWTRQRLSDYSPVLERK